jgi:hypothetical protein
VLRGDTTDELPGLIANLNKVLENKELSDLVTALGCGVGKGFDATRLRYGKVILLADADSDGHHIATLLLTFIYRHMRGLIDAGEAERARTEVARRILTADRDSRAAGPEAPANPRTSNRPRPAREVCGYSPSASAAIGSRSMPRLVSRKSAVSVVLA